MTKRTFRAVLAGLMAFSSFSALSALSACSQVSREHGIVVDKQINKAHFEKETKPRYEKRCTTKGGKTTCRTVRNGTATKTVWKPTEYVLTIYNGKTAGDVVVSRDEYYRLRVGDRR